MTSGRGVVIVVDTTVLMYAVGTAHALAGPSASLFRAIAKGELRATTTAEVIQEFVHVRARRRNRSDAAALGRDFAAALAPLLAIGDDDLLAGLSLFEKMPRLGAFDGVLAAAAKRAGASVASADRAFADVDGLTYLDLASPSFLVDAAR